MKQNKWGLAFLLGMILIVLSACGAGSASDGESGDANGNSEGNSDGEEQVIELATSADYPPFESMNEDGEIVGFDIDIANAIADELGYELEINDMNFDGLIGALQSGRADMVMAGMSATEERSENVNFSTSYHSSGEMFVTNPDSDITSIEDLDGTTVGVQLGTIQEEGAQTLQEDYDFELQSMDKATNIIQELKTGRIDVGYLDKTVAEGYVEEQNLAGFDDPTEAAPGMAIAFPKDGDEEFYNEVNDLVEQFLEDGTIEELEEKWELNE
ncbi:ABC transporter substrate-binding protein [Alkalibacillus salilacus]|uniref:Polar amino acid transport system substrate-binding protein n=1 Tax=Alkalibacillus salilacus TaxID=284582 RepID=A0ABT9VEC4_9BACI|nr:ABC transporter substrate-binding protein [Alkalibacillus salilacus]MDQ0159308.1 polar amino acid transport system substrate-binding protein [Alkalibacillus salilacus]